MPRLPALLPSRELTENQPTMIRQSLAAWATLALRPEGHEPAQHHRILIQALEDVGAGRCDRLMVLMPPGSAKSTYASVIFPAWWFTGNPRSEIIAASHTASLAEHFGRRVRNLIAAHSTELELRLAADHRAAGRWEVRSLRAEHEDACGSYFAAGVRGPIIGRRADLAIIDDPVKSQAEADSALLREATWNWYRADLLTRLKPRGRVVLIMTRWHEDDLGGRLLASQPEEWRCLRLPALAEADDPLGRPPGAALWPEWEDAAALERKRSSIGTRAFSALFQQNPRPAEGGMFRADRVFNRAMPDLDGGRTVRAWDLAGTEKRSGNDPDWTVGLKLHRGADGHFCVLDVVRLRGGPHAVEQAITATARADGAVFQSFPRDPGQAAGFQERYFAGFLAGTGFGFSPERGSKTQRASPAAAQTEAGNLSLVRASWNAAFLDELRGFPDGGHDDQVDALSRAFAWLVMVTGEKPARRLNMEWMTR